MSRDLLDNLPERPGTPRYYSPASVVDEWRDSINDWIESVLFAQRDILLQMENLAQSMQTPEGTIALIGSLQKAQKALEDHVSSLEQQLQDEIAALTQAVTDAQGRTNTIISGLTTEVATLNETITTLQASGTVTPADIAALTTAVANINALAQTAPTPAPAPTTPTA